MFRRSPVFSIAFVILLLGGLSVGLIWANHQFAQSTPGGAHFLVNWYSSRSLFIDGINPYSQTAQSNMESFARLEANVNLEEGARFDSPLFAAFITLPFALIKDYEMARAVWMAVSEMLIVALVYMALSLARWKVKKGVLSLLVVFALFWFHGLYPILSGSMVVFVSLMVTSVFLAVRARQYEFAGVLLGLSLIQPNASLVFIAFALYWSIRYRHSRLLFWFIASVLLLSGAAALIRPQWFIDYLRVIIQPSGTMNTIGQVFQSFLPAAGRRIGWLLTGFTVLILIFEWFITRKKDFEAFYWTGLLSLTLTPWIGLPTEPVLFLVTLPAFIFGLALWNERWPRISALLTVLVNLLLFAGIWLIYFGSAGNPVSSIPGLYFAQPLIVTIMLYWVRWWAINKPSVWFEQLAKG